ncbi:MAG: hypothetical protein JW885_11815 [Deltaproteobacteria bacterium]|nr:hypothetical protein [Candidatus Zymogenaceae bacterium]
MKYAGRVAIVFLAIMVCAGVAFSAGDEWTVTASSRLDPQGDNTYEAKNVLDNNLDTAWVEGTPNYGQGEFIRFRLDVDYGPGAYVSGFAIHNGYCKSSEVWSENSRVRILAIYINDILMERIVIADTPDLQTFTFPTSYYVTKGDVLTFEIAEVYKGTTYTDTCISELNLFYSVQ